jgi:hypothetical protein
MKRFQLFGALSILAATYACQSHPARAGTAETPARESVTAPRSPPQPAATTPTRTVAHASATHSPSHIPRKFTEYGSQSLDNDRRCVVGTATDDDGMNARAIAYVTGANAAQPTWVNKLDLPPDTYQSRATHCTSSGHALFVLLQSNTQPQQTLSQTLLRVARLDPATGTVQLQRNVHVPDAFSAWVDLGPEHFQWKGDVLTVVGNRRPESSRDERTTFTIRMDSHLNPVQDEQP